MRTGEKGAASPAQGVWVRFLILIPLVIVMFFASSAYIRSVCSTYSVWTPPAMGHDAYDAYGPQDVKIATPGVVKLVNLEHFPTGAARLTFEAVGNGETDVEFGSDLLTTYWSMRVQDGAIIVGGVNFSGWESIHICVCILFATLSILFASVLVRLVKARWYGYEMVASGGCLIFFLFQTVLFVFLLARNSFIEFADMAYFLGESASWFAQVSFIPMGILALLVSISNIVLIRREGMRPVNLLGIAVSLVWLGANYFWIKLWEVGPRLGLTYDLLIFIDSIVAVTITFGECLLISTMVCAWIASRHVPQSNKDYLIVLGCGIRKDGTPSPLLAGRVDRARTFNEERVAAGEPPATFVPSGGQGPDEVMSEAQSMANYLQTMGVDRSNIVLESKSSTTRENMAFSREVIEAHARKDVHEVTVGFSTTNYHVFRGYVCAHDEGMTVEGMGSKTKAYFWPNAFLREFAGLLVAQWKSILQALLILCAVYAAAEYILLAA